MATNVSKSSGSPGGGSVGGVFVRITGSSSNLLREINRATTSMQAAEKIFNRGALGIATVSATAFTAVGIAAVREFGKFEAEMVKSQAIMGNLAKSTKDEMNKVARELSTNLPISAAKAAESFFFLASAGFDAEQSISTLDEVARFAVAGQFDMATATDLATDAQSALGLTVKDVAANTANMVRVTDTLVEANTLANATVRQFSESLTNEAAAAMRAWGIEIEEGVAVLAAYADQGVKGQKAGSSFARVLRLMTAAAAENGERFKTLGIDIYDPVTGELRDMADIIEELTNAILPLDDELKSVTLTSLGFQAKLQGVILPLLGTSDAIREYRSEMEQMKGTTQEVADKQLESFHNQLFITRNRINDLFLSIGQELLPVMQAWIGVLNDSVTSTESLNTTGESLGNLFRKTTIPIIGVLGDTTEKLTVVFVDLGLATLTLVESFQELSDSNLITFFREAAKKGGQLLGILNEVHNIFGARKLDPIDDDPIATRLNEMTSSAKEAESEISNLIESLEKLRPDTTDASFSERLEQMLAKFDAIRDFNIKLDEVQQELKKSTVGALDKTSFSKLMLGDTIESVVTTEITGRRIFSDKEKEDAKKRAEEMLNAENERERLIDSAVEGVPLLLQRPEDDFAGPRKDPGFDFLRNRNLDIMSGADRASQSIPGIGFGGQLQQLEREREMLREHQDELKKISDDTTTLYENEKEERLRIQKELAEGIKQIEMEMLQTNLAAVESTFGSMTSIMEDTVGKQNIAYKTMFAAEKAFAIASSLISIQKAIADVGASEATLPTKLAGMATIAASMAGIVSAISSTKLQLTGAKAQGGRVSAGTMFPVGERGMEMFAPDQDGTIIPNDQLGGNRSGNVHIEIQNYGSPDDVRVEESQEGENKKLRIIISETKKQLAADVAKGGGEFPMALEGAYGLQRGKRR